MPDDPYPFKGLAGVGVAYKLIEAHRGGRPAPSVLDLVAVGTIADVMPLTDENRGLGQVGLAHLNEMLEVVRRGEVPRGGRPGLASLAARAIKTGAVRASDIAFRVAPAINAVGRIGLDPRLIVLLLTSDDPYEIAALADRLLAANTERQQLTRGLLEQALTQVDPENDTVLVAQLTIPIGLAGLVAGQMAQRFHRPAIVLDQRGGGSGRSVPGVSLIDLLAGYASWCTAGGHHAACGVSRVKRPEAFREAIRHHPLAVDLLTDTLIIERVANLTDLSASAFTDLERLGPFGEGQRTPLWLVRDVRLVNERVVGNDHYAFDLLDDVGVRRRAIWFGAAAMIGKYPRADAVVELEFDTYHADANLLIRDLSAPGVHNV